jgi:hypothetical protein
MLNDMETNNMTQWVIIAAAVVVLIVGGAWLALRGRTPAPASDTAAATTTVPATTTVDATTNVPKGTVTATSDGESVAAADQAAGKSVMLSSISLTRASWIAVRDDKSILGAAWFPSSATAGSIKLQRETVAGTSYRLVIYVDDGDKKFDYKKDQLIIADGGPVGGSFKAN